jgi:AcrR family transcriptional regulator
VTHHERLVDAITDVAAREGYAATTVAKTIARAGVSRATFYEHFRDRADCFAAALADGHARLLDEVRLAVESEPPELALEATLAATVRFAQTEPQRARVLMNEALAGGPAALDQRDRQVSELAAMIQARGAEVPKRTRTPDISSAIAIGAVQRMLADRLRHDRRETSGLRDGLSDWIRRYAQPIGRHRWASLEPTAPAPPSPYVSRVPLQPPPPPAGRPERARERVEAERQRILFATADVAKARGYTATTVADIARAADLDPRTFSSLFGGKQEAYMAIHGIGFEETMGVTAGAFFAGSTWPERTWDAGRAFTQFLALNPTLAHVGFVESYAVGPGALERVENILSAFTIFLQEGYEYAAQQGITSDPPGPVALEAIAAANFEISYHQTRKGEESAIAGLVAHLTLIALAPFLGMQRANRFVDAKLSPRGPRPARRPSPGSPESR